MSTPLDFITNNMSDGIVVKNVLSPQESETMAKKATLEKKFNYLRNPESLETNYLETIYDPYYLVMYENKGQEKLDVINAISEETNLLLKERLISTSL